MSIQESTTSYSFWPPYSGWYSDSRDIIPYEGPPIPASSITERSVKLAMFYSSQVSDGFSVAFLDIDLSSRTDQSTDALSFTGKLVLDSSGELYQIPQPGKSRNGATQSYTDIFTHITSVLASRVLALPLTGSFRNTWRVEHDMSCRPFDILYLHQDLGPADSEPKFKQTTVYGYIMPPSVKADTPPFRALPLSKQVGEYTTLPPELDQLYGLSLEAYHYTEGEIKNRHLIEAIRRIVTKGNI